MSNDMFTKELINGNALDISGHIRVGASWDVSGRGKSGLMGKLARRTGGDLDALAIMCDTEGNPVRMAGLDNNDPMKDGSVIHSGDNTTGKGEGDDEVIDLHLDRIKPNIGSIVLVVAAFKESNLRAAKAFGDGASGFGGVENVSFVFYDGTSTTPDFEIMPSLLGQENTCLMAKLTRVDGSDVWQLRKINNMVHVKHGDKQALLRSAINA